MGASMTDRGEMNERACAGARGPEPAGPIVLEFGVAQFPKTSDYRWMADVGNQAHRSANGPCRLPLLRHFHSNHSHDGTVGYG
jgi:hypothetical protein